MWPGASTNRVGGITGLPGQVCFGNLVLLHFPLPHSGWPVEWGCEGPLEPPGLAGLWWDTRVPVLSPAVGCGCWGRCSWHGHSLVFFDLLLFQR